MTNGGGAGVLAADRAGDLGIEVAVLAAATVERLNKLLPAYWSHGNPVDILGDAPPDTYREAVSACLADPDIDGVLALLTPQAMTKPADAAEAVVEAAKGSKKPLLACWMGESSVAEARTLLSASGIPDFPAPEQAVEAFAHLARHQLNQRLSLELPGPLSDLAAPDVTAARMIVEAALAEGREMLSDVESKAVLRAFHIPCAMTWRPTAPRRR